MRQFYKPDSWYEQDIEQEHICNVCTDKSKDLEHMTDHMTGVIEMLYGKGKIDLGRLEDNLSEVCAVLGIKLPAEMPNLERKRSDLFSFGVSLTREFAKNL